MKLLSWLTKVWNLIGILVMLNHFSNYYHFKMMEPMLSLVSQKTTPHFPKDSNEFMPPKVTAGSRCPRQKWVEWNSNRSDQEGKKRKVQIWKSPERLVKISKFTNISAMLMTFLGFFCQPNYWYTILYWTFSIYDIFLPFQQSILTF